LWILLPLAFLLALGIFLLNKFCTKYGTYQVAKFEDQNIQVQEMVTLPIESQTENNNENDLNEFCKKY